MTKILIGLWNIFLGTVELGIYYKGGGFLCLVFGVMLLPLGLIIFLEGLSDIL